MRRAQAVVALGAPDQDTPRGRPPRTGHDLNGHVRDDGQAHAASGNMSGGTVGSENTPSGERLQVAMQRTPAIHGQEIAVGQSAIGRIRARYVDVRQSVAGVALAQDLEVRQSAGVLLTGAKVDVQQSASQWLVGGLIQAKQVFAIAVVAAKVEGQVRCLFDARGAFAFGFGAALATGLLRLLVRRR